MLENKKKEKDLKTVSDVEFLQNTTQVNKLKQKHKSGDLRRKKSMYMIILIDTFCINCY